MREMVLNHASIIAPDQHTAVVWLKDMAVAMSDLTYNGVAQNTLRMSRSIYEILCFDNWSLHDAHQELQRRDGRDEYVFLARLATKTPLLSETNQDIADRFRLCEALECEAKSLSAEDGEPLVMCAITDGIAVGFPSERIWQQPQVTVTFIEIIGSGGIEEVSEIVDNLTQPAHAKPISARYRAELRQLRTPAALWEVRETAFPNLTFGPEVESHLAGLDLGILQTVVGKLESLDEATSLWRDAGGPAPNWTCKVSPESVSVQQSPKLREDRRFMSVRGTRELFMWHARYGSGGRIHLRFDPHTHEIEIGYIGKKLPT